MLAADVIHTIHITPTAHAEGRSLRVCDESLESAVHHAPEHHETCDGLIHLVHATAPGGRTIEVLYEHPAGDRSTATVWGVFA